MEAVIHHSVNRAADEAVNIWALASAQYPKKHIFILNIVTARIIESLGAFALNARRTLEILPGDEKYQLEQPRWNWEPRNESVVVYDLRDALNRIIHANKLEVGFEDLPKKLAVTTEGSVVVPYIRAETDRKKLAFIDPFALSHAFLYCVYPKLVSIVEKSLIK